MKIIFFASGNFAVKPLEAILHSGRKVLAVVTQPDKKAGRGLHLGYTPVKAFALEHKLKIYQPESLKGADTLNLLKDLNADLFVVVAYGKILPAAALAIPKIFAVNLHASALPKYRGAAPVNWVIIKGEKRTGVTIIKMSEKMDAGEIILQKEIDIDSRDNALTLDDKLSELGAKALIEALRLIESGGRGGVTPPLLKAQDERLVSFAPKLNKTDGLINWQMPAKEICDLVRGCLDWPGAFTYYKGKALKIWRAEVDAGIQSKETAGTVVEASKQGIIVRAGKGSLIIKELQLESGRRMNAAEFIAGHKLNIGGKLA